MRSRLRGWSAGILTNAPSIHADDGVPLVVEASAHPDADVYTEPDNEVVTTNTTSEPKSIIAETNDRFQRRYPGLADTAGCNKLPEFATT